MIPMFDGALLAQAFAEYVKPPQAFLDRFGDECDAYKAQLYPSREAWLEGRKGTIGASSAATVAGVGSKTRRHLYFKMIGELEEPDEDFSENANVQRGVNEEPLIRAMFALEHPNYEVYDGTNMIFRSKQFPIMSCTLDMILVDRETGNPSIGEIKSCLWTKKWASKYAPDGYFMQNLWQLAVTGWQYAILRPRIICPSIVIERALTFDAADDAVSVQMEQLVSDALDMAECIEKRVEPTERIML